MKGTMKRRSFLAAAAASAAVACRRTRAFDGFAFVANREGRAIAVVDLSAFAVARQIRLDAAPAAVISDAARRVIYALTPENGTVHEIDVADLALRRRVRTGPSASVMRLSPDGSSLWIAAHPPALVRVSTETFRVEQRISLPGPPADFDLARYAPSAAVTFESSSRIALVDLQGSSLRQPAPLAAPAGAVRFRSDGRQALVTHPEARLITVVDASSGDTVVQLPLAIRPENLCFSADGGQLFLTGEGMDAVVTLYPYRTEVAQTRLAGHSPGAMAASGSLLFVANPASGDVTIVEIETQRVVAVAAVGADPCFVTVTPGDHYALVLNRRSGDLAILRIAAITPNRTKTAPLFTLIPVGSMPVSAAVQAI